MDQQSQETSEVLTFALDRGCAMKAMQLMMWGTALVAMLKEAATLS